MAEALDYAHQQGIIHRDVKPANILLDADGKAWVTDFGLARIETGAALTMSGDLLGTLRYMSPEQVLGKRIVVDHRTDVYSLGVTLYELLTLTPAFPDDDRQELLRNIAFDEPPPPRKLKPSVPSELETIVLKAIEKNPSERYETAQELADDLQRYLDDQPIRAKRPNLMQRARKWSRRHRTAVTWTVLALCAISVVSSVAAVRLAAALRRADIAEGRLEEEKESAKRGEQQARRSERFWRYLYQARWARYSGWMGQREDALDALREASELVPTLDLSDDDILELRNETIAAFALADLRKVRELPVLESGIRFLHQDAKSKLYAYCAEDDAYIRSLPKGREILRFPNDEPGWPLLSPDGRFVAVSDNQTGRCRLWNLSTGQPVTEKPLSFNELAIGFAQDSGMAAIGGRDRRVRFISLPSGVEAIEPLVLASVPQSIALSPSGDTMAVVHRGQRRLDVWDVAARVSKSIAIPAEPYVVAWSTKGARIAVGCWDDNIYILDVDSGSLGPILRGHEDPVTRLGFSQSGKLLASFGWDGTLRMWDLVTGRHAVRSQAYDLWPRFNSDDRYLAFSKEIDEAAVWEIVKPLGYRALPGRLEDISPDGQLLVGVDGDTFQIWQLPDRHLLAEFPARSSKEALANKPAAFALFHPDGESLITATADGLQRWPIQWSEQETDLDVGLPIRICSAPMGHDGSGAVSISGDGGWFAYVTGSREVTVVNLLGFSEPVRIGTSHDVTAVSLSRDGKWLAVNAWEIETGKRIGFEVWSVPDRSRLAELPGGGGGWWARVKFSADGRWLLGGPTARGNGNNLWEGGTWRLARELPGGSGPCAVSSDGRLVATDHFNGHGRVVRLFDAERGQELAQFEAPDSHQFHRASEAYRFSGNGETLAAYEVDGGIHIWDLREIRRELASLGLDWDAPPYHKLRPAEKETAADN